MYFRLHQREITLKFPLKIVLVASKRDVVLITKNGTLAE